MGSLACGRRYTADHSLRPTHRAENGRRIPECTHCLLTRAYPGPRSLPAHLPLHDIPATTWSPHQSAAMTHGCADNSPVPVPDSAAPPARHTYKQHYGPPARPTGDVPPPPRDRTGAKRKETHQRQDLPTPETANQRHAQQTSGSVAAA